MSEAPAESAEVFLFTAAAGAEEEEKADPDHAEKVDDKDNQFRCVAHAITTTFIL